MNAEPTLNVQKTLVIGLGTTGTDICRRIAGRIEWEYGALERTPWVRFLCLETDSKNTPRSLRQDFIGLTITSGEYAGIAEFSQANNEAIHLNQWADRATLDKLPSKKVDDGVGNIRMIGRLAFFHDRNYREVRRRAESRLNELRKLNGAKATQQLDQLQDGTRPQVVFAGETALCVFVVGTLCGGTCSGLAGDFGFFAQMLTSENEKVIGIFTLPRPELSTVQDGHAARLKKNAYAALVELNHYSLLGDVEKPAIKFPDQPFDIERKQPYDLPYLVMPRRTSRESMDELAAAIADRIFLNTFVPETDPFGGVVNVPFTDREGHAHVFSTFGLATLEFPARQVIEASAETLLLRAIREWKSRPLPENQIAPRLEELGLTWPRLRRRLLATPDNVGLEKRMQEQADIVLQKANDSAEELARELSLLRAACDEASGAVGGTGLPPGLAKKTARDNVEGAAQQALTNLQNHVQANLLKFEEGPGRLRDLLAAARKRLNDLQNISVHDPHAEIVAVDEAVTRLNQSRRKRHLWSRAPEILDPQALPALRAALQREVEARLDAACQTVIKDMPRDGRAESGVATRTLRLFDPVLDRVDNLRARLIDFQTLLERQARESTEKKPQINGVTLFDPDPREGTVRKSYEERLLGMSPNAQDDWRSEEDKQVRDVIAAWKTLPDELFSPEADWLKGQYLAGSSGEPLPPPYPQTLLDTSTRPFSGLRDVSVIRSWKNRDQRDNDIRDVNDRRRPFLEVDRNEAQRGGRGPIASRLLALVPDGEGADPEFLEQIEAAATNITVRACPDPYRAVLMEEMYRFPLYGVREIVNAAGSLAQAECSDFPTFHTRKDVFWTGLTNNEIEATRKAEELVVVSVLLEELTPGGGRLNLPVKPTYFGDKAERHLPYNIRGAARALVFERGEVNGAMQELAGCLEILRNRITQQREKARNGSQSDIVFIEKLQARMDSHDFDNVPGWVDRATGRNLAGRLIARFFARDPELYRAYVHVRPPDPALIANMKHHQGDVRPIGGEYSKDGLYCTRPDCCGWIGKDEADAALHEWRCSLNPVEHDYA